MTNYELPGEPYVLQQWDVTFSKPGERDVHTFTWGQDHAAAVESVAGQVRNSAPAWDGWTYAVASEPRATVTEV